MDIESNRILVSRFLKLPYRYQITIAKNIGIFVDSDTKLSDDELYRTIFYRVSSSSLFSRLCEEVDSMHERINRTLTL